MPPKSGEACNFMREVCQVVLNLAATQETAAEFFASAGGDDVLSLVVQDARTRQLGPGVLPWMKARREAKTGIPVPSPPVPGVCAVAAHDAHNMWEKAIPAWFGGALRRLIEELARSDPARMSPEVSSLYKDIMLQLSVFLGQECWPTPHLEGAPDGDLPAATGSASSAPSSGVAVVADSGSVPYLSGIARSVGVTVTDGLSFVWEMVVGTFIRDLETVAYMPFFGVTMADVFSFVWEVVAGAAVQAWEMIAHAARSIGATMADGFSFVWEMIASAARSFSDSVTGGFSVVWEMVAGAAVQAWETIASEATRCLEGMGSGASVLREVIVAEARNLWAATPPREAVVDGLVVACDRPLSAIDTFMRTRLPRVWAYLGIEIPEEGVWDAFVDWLRAALPELMEACRSAAFSLLHDASDAAVRLWGATVAEARSLWGATPPAQDLLDGFAVACDKTRSAVDSTGLASAHFMVANFPRMSAYLGIELPKKGRWEGFKGWVLDWIPKVILSN